MKERRKEEKKKKNQGGTEIKVRFIGRSKTFEKKQQERNKKRKTNKKNSLDTMSSKRSRTFVKSLYDWT